MHKVITIAQQKGGAGKTTLSAHLAIALSQKGLKVAALDVDPQGSLTAWHQQREQRFGEGYTGLHFANLSGWRLTNEISRLKNECDVIIVDSPPHTQTDAKTAIRAADLVLIPMQPSPMDRWATDATIEIAEREGKEHYVVLNRVTANSKLAKEFEKKLGNRLKNGLGARVQFASCLMEGRCVTETAPASPAADEVRTLTTEIYNLLNPQAKMKDAPKATKAAVKTTAKAGAKTKSKKAAAKVG